MNSKQLDIIILNAKILGALQVVREISEVLDMYMKSLKDANV